MTVSSSSPDHFELFTELEEIHLLFVSLAESACLAVEAEALPENFSAGLNELFRYALKRLGKTIDEVRPISTKAAPDEAKAAKARSLMRDQFILDSFSKGFSTSDIAQLFNMKRTAIDQAIARLSKSQDVQIGGSPPETAEKRTGR